MIPFDTTFGILFLVIGSLWLVELAYRLTNHFCGHKKRCPRCGQPATK